MWRTCLQGGSGVAVEPIFFFKQKTAYEIYPIDDLRKDVESAVTPPSDLEAPLSSPASAASLTSNTSAPEHSHDVAPATHDVAPATSAEPAPAVTHVDVEPPASPPADGHAAALPASD